SQFGERDRLGLELVGVSFSGFHFHSVSVAYRLVQKSSALQCPIDKQVTLYNTYLNRIIQARPVTKFPP
ncbi:MAG: hypothetical protein ACI9DF_005799, partial [Verrucomicrobiales bacterium]